jgi:hypothetical protein
MSGRNHLETTVRLPHHCGARRLFAGDCKYPVQLRPGTDASPADLFRYSAPGTRSFLGNSNTCSGYSAYFSINSGNTDYNNCPFGGDYGDWVSIYP